MKNRLSEIVKRGYAAQEKISELDSDKLKLVQKCYDDIVKDISDMYLNEEDFERGPKTSEIKADYMSIGAEEYDMTTEEFEYMFSLIEDASIFECIAVC